MSDGIHFFSKDEVEQYVTTVMSQTNYTYEEAVEQLRLYNGDYMKVIKNYMGIPDKKEGKVKSINQEIFRQIRIKLDNSMKVYNEKHPINIDEVVENFKEFDKCKKQVNK
jgi:UDP-N-acetyl-D-mannosaminuronate dehydrogenase